MDERTPEPAAPEPMPALEEAARESALQAIPLATASMLAALDEVGISEELRQATSCALATLDRCLPRQTLDELLAACDAYALITVPAAQSAGNPPPQEEAAHLLAQLQMVHTGAMRRPGGFGPRSATTAQGVLLRAALQEPPVSQALHEVIALMASLAAVPEADPPAPGSSYEEVAVWVRRARQVSRPFLVPAGVVVLALAVIGLLLGTLSHPSAEPARSRGALYFPALPAEVTATPAALPRSLLAVTPLNHAPCRDAQFTIAYTGRDGQITWIASVDDESHVLLSLDGQTWRARLTGILRPGQQVSIFVQANEKKRARGALAVSTGDSRASAVTYDSTGC